MGKAKKSISTAEHELVAQYELFKVIAEQNHEKILEYEVINDTVRIYNVVNRQFVLEEEYENYVQGDIFGNAFVAKEDKNAYRKAFKKCLKKTTHMIMDIRCALGGKNLEWHRLYLVSVAGEDKQVTRIAGRFASIHKEKMDAEKMRLKAEIDALTGIYNHIAFEEECGKAVKDCDSNALFLMLDVDDFKMINDTQGHAVGDMVLGQTGETLKTIVEGRGLAGRLGGDEFAAFVWGFSDEEQMKEFCKELRSRLKMIIFDMEYSASIGVSVLDGREIGFQDMYYEADQAVYASKNAGKNQVTFYSEIENVVIQETKAQKEQLIRGHTPDSLSLASFSRIQTQPDGRRIPMLFVCYPKCSTCKKARAFLDAHDIPAEVRDIKEENPTEQELRDWHARSGLPLKRLFNTSGQLYRSLELSKKLPGMSEDEQFALLASDGMLVRRPILVAEGFALFGFRQKEWEEKL